MSLKNNELQAAINAELVDAVEDREITDAQIELEVMVHSLLNFTSVHNTLCKHLKKHLSKNDKLVTDGNIIFIDTLYMEVGKKILDHPLVDEMLDDDRKQEIITSVDFFNQTYGNNPTDD